MSTGPDKAISSIEPDDTASQITPVDEGMPSADRIALSVVVPALNEEGAIATVLEKLEQTCSKTALPFEILVVDDGSGDRTGEVAKVFEYVTVLRHEENRGYGAALKTGIERAKGEIVAIIDADGTYPTDEVPRLIQMLREKSCDMVVASRRGSGAKHPISRRPVKLFLRLLANFVAGTSIPDPNSGLRVFKRSIARRFIPILPGGFSFTTTLTLAMLTNGYSVVHVTTDYHARVGRSKIRPIRDTVGFLQLTIRSGLYFAPLKIFFSIGGGLIALAIVWGVLSKLLLDQVADVTTLLLILAGLQIAALGLLAELINHRVPSRYRDD